MPCFQHSAASQNAFRQQTLDLYSNADTGFQWQTDGIQVLSIQTRCCLSLISFGAQKDPALRPDAHELFDHPFIATAPSSPPPQLLLRIADLAQRRRPLVGGRGPSETGAEYAVSLLLQLFTYYLLRLYLLSSTLLLWLYLLSCGCHNTLEGSRLGCMCHDSPEGSRCSACVLLCMPK